MATIEISMEQFLELHEKAVKYDLLKKEYERTAYHSKAEEVVFAEPLKEIVLLEKEGEKNNGN